jgi:hypothetical protein
MPVSNLQHPQCISCQTSLSWTLEIHLGDLVRLRVHTPDRGVIVDPERVRICNQFSVQLRRDRNIRCDRIRGSIYPSDATFSLNPNRFVGSGEI